MRRHGILIYLNTGAVTLNGNGDLNLPPYKSNCTPKYTGTCYDGLSIWQRGSGQATLNGTDSFSLGTVTCRPPTSRPTARVAAPRSTSTASSSPAR